MNKKIIAGISVFLIAGISGYFFSQKPSAPDISIQTLDNQAINIAKDKKVYLVNFWATSCPGCMKEMPDFVKAYKHLQSKSKNFELVAIAMSYDQPEYINNYILQNHIPFKVVHDQQGNYAKAFGGVQLTPTTFIVDKEGKIVQKMIGEQTFEQITQKIESLL